MAQSVSLSTVGTATIVLNPVSKSTTVLLSASTGSSLSTIQVDFSIDDPSIPGGPTTTWALLSSAASMGSSTITGNGLVWTVLSPICQVRLNSTAIVASSAVFTLKALQSVTA